MGAKYATSLFVLTDTRILAIERTLSDLDPFLKHYASSSSGERLSDLRELLQKGARLAFRLFGQPSFWKFDWEAVIPDAELVAESNTRAEHSTVCPLWDDMLVFGCCDKQLDPSERRVLWPGLIKMRERDGLVSKNADGVIVEKQLCCYI